MFVSLLSDLEFSKRSDIILRPHADLCLLVQQLALCRAKVDKAAGLIAPESVAHLMSEVQVGRKIIQYSV